MKKLTVIVSFLVVLGAGTPLVAKKLSLEDRFQQRMINLLQQKQQGQADVEAKLNAIQTLEAQGIRALSLKKKIKIQQENVQGLRQKITKNVTELHENIEALKTLQEALRTTLKV